MNELKIYTSTEEMGYLVPSWNNLQIYTDSPIGRYEWILSCTELLDENSSLYLIVHQEGSKPVAIAPLVRSNAYFSALELCGVSDHGEPCDFSYKDEATLKMLLNNIAQMKAPLYLQRIPTDSPVRSAIETAYKGKGIVICRSQIGCPFIEITGPDEEIESVLPTRLKSDLRRARRKANELGAVQFEIHAPKSTEELTPLWNELLKVEAAGWKGRSKTALKEDQKLGLFYKQYAINACKTGMLRISFLKMADRIVAVQMSVVYAKRFWILKIGYDEEYRNVSPGMILMYETLRYAAQMGCKSYEFLGTAEVWTRRWTKSERDNSTIRVFPYTFVGIALLCKLIAISVVYKIQRLFRSK